MHHSNHTKKVYQIIFVVASIIEYFLLLLHVLVVFSRFLCSCRTFWSGQIAAPFPFGSAPFIGFPLSVIMLTWLLLPVLTWLLEG